jgi:MFS family permease
MCEEVIWTVGGLYATEAFPTAIRGSALGAVFMAGNLGSLVSSSVAGELLAVHSTLPMAVMAAALLVGATICCLLPRDRKRLSLLDSAP